MWRDVFGQPGNESAKNVYAMLRGTFPESSYVTSQLATCFYNMRWALLRVCLRHMSKELFAGLHFFHVFCKLHGTCGTAAFPPRNFDSSQAAFEEMRKRDPYRLTSLDTYSNILFVKDVREVDG